MTATSAGLWNPTKPTPSGCAGGEVTTSAETTGQADEFDWLVYENLPAFPTLIRHLPASLKDALISYYVLRKTQQQIGELFGGKQERGRRFLLASMRLLKSGSLKATWIRDNPDFDATVVWYDPDILGEFRIRMYDPQSRRKSRVPVFVALQDYCSAIRELSKL